MASEMGRQPHHFNTLNALDGWVSYERNFANELKKGCKRRVTQELNCICAPFVSPTNE